jgi:enoyl-CoA hydratase
LDDGRRAALPSEDQAMAIRYELQGQVAVITMDRPETRNAMDLEHYVALGEAWRRFQGAPQARVAVLTGAGESFCSGADLKDFIPTVTAMDRGELDRAEMPEEILNWAIHKPPSDLVKPVVAAVNGFCVASGMEMLLGTDIRVASETASFAVPEVRRGLFCSGGSTVRLPLQIPYVHAMDLLLTGRRITAAEALSMGLINRVVPPDKLMDAAMDYARLLAANAPKAVRETKRSVLEALGLHLHETYARELEIGQGVFAHPDAQEGPVAFLEKRPPRWRDEA